MHHSYVTDHFKMIFLLNIPTSKPMAQYKKINPEIIYEHFPTGHLFYLQVWQCTKAIPFPSPYWKQQEHYITINSTQTNVLFILYN